MVSIRGSGADFRGHSYCNMATAQLRGCRLCWEYVSTKRIINIFTRKAMEKGWGRRINALLDISVSQDDELPAYICNKCTARIVTLKKAFIDLSDFKKSV